MLLFLSPILYRIQNFFFYSFMKTFVSLTLHQYCLHFSSSQLSFTAGVLSQGRDSRGFTGVLALPLILCISLRRQLCVYVSTSDMEVLQTEEVCITQRITVTEFFSLHPSTLEFGKDSQDLEEGPVLIFTVQSFF